MLSGFSGVNGGEDGETLSRSAGKLIHNSPRMRDHI